MAEDDSAFAAPAVVTAKEFLECWRERDRLKRELKIPPDLLFLLN
jgi:hypothetical protein